MVHDRAVRRQPLLDPGEALLDAPPARGDEIDEEGEVVDAGVALCKQVALDPLEPADQLIHEPANLCEVAAHREDLGAQPVLDGVADAARERRLDLGGRGRERLDLLARALERRVELRGLDPSRCRLVDPGLGPLDRLGIHWFESTAPGGQAQRAPHCPDRT